MRSISIPIPGFSSDTTPSDKHAFAIFGGPGAGKTQFCVSAPDPIGFISLDRKSRKTVDKVNRDLNKVIYMSDPDLIKVIQPMKMATLPAECANKTLRPSPKSPAPLCCAKHFHRWQVDRIKSAVYTLHEHPAIRTIVIDGMTQFWEDVLFAEFGRSQRIMPRDRGPVNREMKDFIGSLSDKHLILTHEARAVYKNDKVVPGKYELAGWPHTGYNVNCEVEFVCDEEKGEGTEGRFAVNVHKCQSNPNIQGPGGKKLLEDDQITFDYLATYIDPDWDPDNEVVDQQTRRLKGELNG